VRGIVFVCERDVEEGEGGDLGTEGVEEGDEGGGERAGVGEGSERLEMARGGGCSEGVEEVGGLGWGG